MDREYLNARLRSIATQAVEAQSEADIEKVLDLLTDMDSDLRFAMAAAEKGAV